MIEARALGRDQGTSLGEYLQDWLSHAHGRVRVSTYEGYESVIRLYVMPSLGEVPLEELHPLHLQRLYASLLHRARPLSAGTVLNLHLVLTQALHQAVRWGILLHTSTVSGSGRSRGAGRTGLPPRRPGVSHCSLSARI